MKTITFYSYKGGVGRTLALANIAKRLSEFGKKVCLIDFDLEAPGLHSKFRNNIGVGELKKGIVDYIYEFSHENKMPNSILDYVTTVKFQNKNLSNIDLIAAGNPNLKTYWKKLSRISWSKLFYEENSNGTAFFVDLKLKIEKELNPDFILLDSRTGITDISGVTMSILADEIVLMAAKNEENIEGIKQIIRTLSKPENTLNEGVPKMNFVLSRIPHFTEPTDRIKVQNVKNEVLKSINSFLKRIGQNNYQLERIFLIHSDPELELEEKFKIGYENDRLNLDTKKSPIAVDYLELFEELTKGVLSDDEKQRFNNLRRSKLLSEQARNSKNDKTKKKLLEKAIVLDPNSHQNYNELAAVCLNLDLFDAALESINNAQGIAPENLNYVYMEGLIKMKAVQENTFPEEAESIFQNILKRNKKHLGSLMQLSRIYRRENKLKESLNFLKKVIEYHPNYGNGYNSIGDTYRNMGEYDKALDYIYKALELDPTSIFATATLAEIYAHIGNYKEFYKNLELAFNFGLDSDTFQQVLIEEKIYHQFLEEEKFKDLLGKYDITVDTSFID